MNDNAKKWVAALRSGQYKQGKRRLRDGDAYCCLGVACDLYREAHSQAHWLENEFFVGLAYDDLTLPLAVQEWLGLSSPSGDYGLNTALTDDNDGGQTFASIADTIEAEPEGLFYGR